MKKTIVIIGIILMMFALSFSPIVTETLTAQTEKIKEVGNLMGIELLDHIIIGRNNYFSFREKGML